MEYQEVNQYHFHELKTEICRNRNQNAKHNKNNPDKSKLNPSKSGLLNQIKMENENIFMILH